MPSTQRTTVTSSPEKTHTSTREDPLHTESMTDPLRSCTPAPDTARPRQVTSEPEDGTPSRDSDGSFDFLWKIRAAQEKDSCQHTPTSVDGTRSQPSDRSTKAPDPRQKPWKKLIAIRKKLASVEKYAWDSCNMYALEHNKGGASAETYGRYEKAYRKIHGGAGRAHTRATRAILKVSDGNGNPTAAAGVIDKHYTSLRVTLAGLESDMDMVQVRGANRRSIQNAEGSIAAADQLRDLLKRASVLTLKLGLIGLGVPPEVAEGIATHYAVLLDTVDEVVGNRLILQGKALTENEIATIYALNYVKLVIDQLADKIMGEIMGEGSDYAKLLHSKFSRAKISEILKGTIDRAFIQGPRGPTLAPSPAVLKDAFNTEIKAQIQQQAEIEQGGWDNPAFVGWFADLAFDSVDMVATMQAKGGKLPALSTKKK